ncbi:MAG: exo-alpha-sialidase [Saprospiraceae bacterium]|nr:exo-alpha-sialidase [Saprospiraceae bacterium]
MKDRKILWGLALLFVLLNVSHPLQSQSLVSEFIYEEAPFPECHASTLALTPMGPAAAWFGGTEEKNKDVEIWFSRREGQWTDPVSIAHGKQKDGSRHPCWNPVLHQIKEGPLLLFYKVGPNPREWWGEMKSSLDGGKTWGPSHKLPHGGIGPVKNKPVTLPNGSLLCPSSTEHDGWRVHMEITSDLGKTWEVFPAINDASRFNIIQPSILFHADTLQLLARSKESTVVMAWSYDWGKSWTMPEATELPNPNSGTDALTLADGRQIIIYNHTTVTPGKWGGARSPLNLAISADGRNWKALAVLEDQPGEYSYPAILQDDKGHVHITYTWKRQKVKYRVLDVSTMQGTEMQDGRWPTGLPVFP